MKYNWIPAGDAAFAVMCRTWRDTMSSPDAKETFKWNEILTEPVRMKTGAYIDAYKAFKASDTTANRIIKNATKKEAVSAIREFAASSVRHNPFMTETAKKGLGLHTVDKKKLLKYKARPTAIPTVMVNTTTEHRQHRVRAINPRTGKTVKPDGVHGVRLVWQVGGVRPVSGASILKSQFSRRTDFMISHEETDRGKLVYYAMCYENAKGEAGPWSMISEAYVG